MTDQKHYLPVVGYDCVRCQKTHLEGDLLYADHHYWQSKHGVQRWSECIEDALAACLRKANAVEDSSVVEVVDPTIPF